MSRAIKAALHVLMLTLFLEAQKLVNVSVCQDITSQLQVLVNCVPLVPTSRLEEICYALPATVIPQQTDPRNPSYPSTLVNVKWG